MPCRTQANKLLRHIHKSKLVNKNNFSTKSYVVGTHKNCLNESSFEHPKHTMLKLMGKKIFTILSSKILFYLNP